MLDAEQLAVLAGALSINFSKGLTASQTNILGNLLNSIGANYIYPCEDC